MKVLDHRTICQKLKRLAIEILENNYEEQEILMVGINNSGMTLAKLIMAELEQMKSTPKLALANLRLNPANPTGNEITIGITQDEIKGKVIILVDDVANTGRTIFYAMKPLLSILPKKVEVAVLVDRTHKSFPVKVDYFGLSLATTLMNDIDVQILDVEEQAVFLN